MPEITPEDHTAIDQALTATYGTMARAFTRLADITGINFRLDEAHRLGGYDPLNESRFHAGLQGVILHSVATGAILPVPAVVCDLTIREHATLILLGLDPAVREGCHDVFALDAVIDDLATEFPTPSRALTTIAQIARNDMTGSDPFRRQVKMCGTRPVAAFVALVEAYAVGNPAGLFEYRFVATEAQP